MFYSLYIKMIEFRTLRIVTVTDRHCESQTFVNLKKNIFQSYVFQVVLAGCKFGDLRYDSFALRDYVHVSD